MAFREVSVNEIREVLRVWLGVAGLPAPGYRTIAAHCGLDRKTVPRPPAVCDGRHLQSDFGGKFDGIDRTVMVTHHLKHLFTLPVARQAISARPPGPSVCLLVHLITFLTPGLADIVHLY